MLTGPAKYSKHDGWWLPIMPGIALSLTVLATNMMGDWLRVNNDPTTKR